MTKISTIFTINFIIIMLIYFAFVKYSERSYKSEVEIFSDTDNYCELLKKGVKPANYTPYKLDDHGIENKLLYSADRCSTLKSIFNFYEKPLSAEEADYPLAYGILPYKDISQDRPPIHWASHEIINTVYTTLEFLSHLKSEWKYFQYLSGFDAPLKTNLEMVRIFKTLNGSANFELSAYQMGRLNGKNISNSPLKLYKSSLSALIPRASADYMASSTVPRQLLEFLKDTGFADEGFWATLFANKPKFDMPGSIDGTNMTMPSAYISRYQVWSGNDCGGYMASGSCVYGIKDLPKLLNRTQLVAHKFYPSFEFDGYICLLKEIRKRSDESVSYGNFIHESQYH